MSNLALMTAFGLPRGGGLPPLPLTDLESVYWFEDGSGTAISDASGNGVDAEADGSGFSWSAAGLSITSGNVIHSTGYNSNVHTLVVAFRLDSMTTSTGRWLQGWSSGVNLLLQPNSGTLRIQARANTPSSETVTITARNIDEDEWVIAALSATGGSDMDAYLWADATRYSANTSINNPISATGTTFRLKGSSSPSLTVAAACHYTRALGVAELEEVVAAIKARVTPRGVTWA